MTVAKAGSGYNNGTAGTLTGVELINSVGSGRGAVASVTVGATGEVIARSRTGGRSGSPRRRHVDISLQRTAPALMPSYACPR